MKVKKQTENTTISKKDEIDVDSLKKDKKVLIKNKKLILKTQ